jgi:hypothetical protein
VEGSGRGLFKAIFQFSMEGLRESVKSSLMVTGIYEKVKIKIRELLSTKEVR